MLLKFFAVTISYKPSLYFLVAFCLVVASEASLNASVNLTHLKCPQRINSLHIKALSLPPYVLPNGDFEGELSNYSHRAIEKCCPFMNQNVKYHNLDRKNLTTSDDIEKMIRTEESPECVVFFPVFANRNENEQFNRHFVGLYESPGLAVVQIHKESPIENASKQILALLQTWPIMCLCVLTAMISGIIIWALDCRHNKEFSNGFISGAGDGIWWSFVTMTTVGYGDKSPISFFARFFAIIWMIVGTVLLSMLSAQITAYLTSFQVSEAFSVQDKWVAVPLGLQNFLEKELNLGAKYQEYSTHTIMTAIRERNSSYVDGHNYAIFHDMERIQIWALDNKKTMNIKVKMTIGHRLYMGVVVTYDLDTHTKEFFQCWQTAINDMVAVKNLEKRAQYRQELNKQASTTKATTQVQTETLVVLGAGVGVLIAFGLLWELFKRLKNRKLGSVSHPE